MGKSLKSCGGCGHLWEQGGPASAPRCPKCGWEGGPADDKTPVDGVPAVPPKPASPAPRKVSNRPVAVPPKSHAVRNVAAIVIGLAGAAVGLKLLGIAIFPDWTKEPATPVAKAPEKPPADPEPVAFEKPKVPDRPVPTPEKPPDPVPEQPKPVPPDPSVDYAKEAPFEVIKVEDARTIIVKGPTRNITVRLIGVKVAKSGDPPVHGMPDGRAALDWMKAQLKGQKIHLYYGVLDNPRTRAERDSFGSDMAWAFRASDGLFLNLELLREGHGRYDPAHAREFAAVLEYWDGKR